MSKLETTLVIGLGNPILGDDGVGWRVVEQIEAAYKEKNLRERETEFEYYSLGGLSLMERMVGYKDVIVVDSILTGTRPNGTIYSIPLSSLPDFSYSHTTAIHDASLATALEVGRQMEMVLPDDLWVVAVEAEFVYDFSEELSPDVAKAVPTAVKIVREILEKGIREEKIYDIT